MMKHKFSSSPMFAASIIIGALHIGAFSEWLGIKNRTQDFAVTGQWTWAFDFILIRIMWETGP